MVSSNPLNALIVVTHKFTRIRSTKVPTAAMSSTGKKMSKEARREAVRGSGAKKVDRRSGANDFVRTSGGQGLRRLPGGKGPRGLSRDLGARRSS